MAKMATRSRMTYQLCHILRGTTAKPHQHRLKCMQANWILKLGEFPLETSSREHGNSLQKEPPAIWCPAAFLRPCSVPQMHTALPRQQMQKSNKIPLDQLIFPSVIPHWVSPLEPKYSPSLQCYAGFCFLEQNRVGLSLIQVAKGKNEFLLNRQSSSQCKRRASPNPLALWVLPSNYSGGMSFGETLPCNLHFQGKPVTLQAQKVAQDCGMCVCACRCWRWHGARNKGRFRKSFRDST